ncbi:MAG: FliH/SctL family protein [Planctomycetota bacterium]|nr:FliH/SctL family protein [Planctomycetota bacterium]
MGLIKSANMPAAVSPFSMKDVERQAVALLGQARREAERFLAAAQAAGEELKSQARTAGYVQGQEEGLTAGRKEGFSAGREQGLEERRAELNGLVGALTEAAEQVNASRLELEAAALNDVLRLAVAIAERVTKRLGVLDAQAAVANVAEAMKLVGHESDVRIAIHPSQKAALAEALPRLRRDWPKMEHVELIEDGALAPGGCRVFTAHGQVDGDLDEQLRRIVGDLLPAAKEGS